MIALEGADGIQSNAMARYRIGRQWVCWYNMTKRDCEGIIKKIEDIKSS